LRIPDRSIEAVLGVLLARAQLLLATREDVALAGRLAAHLGEQLVSAINGGGVVGIELASAGVGVERLVHVLLGAERLGLRQESLRFVGVLLLLDLLALGSLRQLVLVVLVVIVRGSRIPEFAEFCLRRRVSAGVVLISEDCLSDFAQVRCRPRSPFGSRRSIELLRTHISDRPQHQHRRGAGGGLP
jgi:hypothetical protein